jgi:hypothetical protein
MTNTTKQPLIYQLKISLKGSRPPIWRRVQLPGDISLLKLHFIVQIAMGWTNSHLHEFIISNQYYGDPRDDEWGSRGVRDETEYLLEQVVHDKGVRFEYRYDFGDGWQHTIQVEDILEPNAERDYPACLNGRRACPPEDVGGIGGYAYFLEAIQDPQHAENEAYLAWIGGEFDPEAFELEQCDAELRNIDRSEMLRSHNRYYSNDIGPELKLYQSISYWLGSLSDEDRNQLEELPLRRDTVHLLSHLRDHHAKGTQSSGNLPLKTIREATAGFVNPPILDPKIGDRTYKLRSELDVWPVYFIHSLLITGGLVQGGKGRRILLTSKGEQFLASEAPIQVWYLLESWWYHTNWEIAGPFSGMDEVLPGYFAYTTLMHLLELPIEIPIAFENFAGNLIRATRFMWDASNKERVRESLNRSIERAVINILRDFRVVKRIEEDAKIGSYRYKVLLAFEITRLGRGLLQALAGGK